MKSEGRRRVNFTKRGFVSARSSSSLSGAEEEEVGVKERNENGGII